MLRRILRTAVRTGVTGLDVFETLVKRGESVFYNTNPGTDNDRDEAGQVQPEEEVQLAQVSVDPEINNVREEIAEREGIEPEQVIGPAPEPEMPKVSTRIPAGCLEIAPALCLQTIKTKRSVCLNQIGRPAVLIFHGQGNANEAAATNFTVQEHFFPEQPVFVANVVPLRIVPAFLRRVAEDEMEKAYNMGIRRFINGRYSVSPEEIIYILPDWKNATVDAFRLGDTWREIGIVVLDGGGKVIEKYQGKFPGQKAIEILETNGIN